MKTTTPSQALVMMKYSLLVWATTFWQVTAVWMFSTQVQVTGLTEDDIRFTCVCFIA
jgi:hypothetical protein